MQRKITFCILQRNKEKHWAFDSGGGTINICIQHERNDLPYCAEIYQVSGQYKRSFAYFHVKEAIEGTGSFFFL